MPNQKEIYESKWQATALLGPLFIAIVVFLYYPGLEMFRMSLFTGSQFGSQLQFAGLENYRRLATSSSFHNSLFVTFAFAFVVIFGTLIIGFLVSFGIHQVASAKATYLIAVIWPYALPPAVAGSVLLFLLHPSNGVISHYIELLPLGITVDWLNSGRQAFVVVSIAAIWKQLGYNIIFLVAAMSSVSEELLEAARLDGIETWRVIQRIYLPLMSPTLIFLVVMNTVYAFFFTFPLIDLMTEGGPGGATNILIYKLYRDAFEFGQFGLAAAESVILFSIVAVLMYIQLAWSDKHAYYGG